MSENSILWFCKAHAFTTHSGIVKVKCPSTDQSDSRVSFLAKLPVLSVLLARLLQWVCMTVYLSPEMVP